MCAFELSDRCAEGSAARVVASARGLHRDGVGDGLAVRVTGAVPALSVKGEFVVFHLEARWGEVCQVARAAVHDEHPFAPGAAEVVVVFVAGRLVAGVFTWQGHGMHIAFVDQQLEVAVNGGQAQGRHLRLRRRQHFVRGEGALGGVDGVADGGALSGRAFHGAIVPCDLVYYWE